MGCVYVRVCSCVYYSALIFRPLVEVDTSARRAVCIANTDEGWMADIYNRNREPRAFGRVENHDHPYHPADIKLTIAA